MRRRSLLSALLTLAVPAIALAAYAAPSDLLLALKFHNQPMDIAYEAHVTHAPEMYASVWLKGSAQSTTPETAKADMKLTFDLVMPEAKTTVRAKMQMRVVDGMFYVYLESVDGVTDHELATLTGKIAGKNWFSVPLNDVQNLHGMGDEAKMRDMAVVAIDALLMMEKTGNTYSLKLRPDGAEFLASALNDMAARSNGEIPEMTESDTMDLRALLAQTNLHIKVQTNAADLPASVKYYVSTAQEGVEFVLQGTATVRSAPLVVEVPRGAQDLQEALEKLDAWPSGAFSEYQGSPPEWEVVPEPEWNEEEWMEEEWPTEGMEPDEHIDGTAPGTSGCPGETEAEQLAAARRGDCGMQRPSRRSLQPQL